MTTITRRGVIAGSTALVVGFSLDCARAEDAGALPVSFKASPKLNGWISIEPDSTITVFTGKAELGQGIATALLQVAAEELKVPLDRLLIVTADTWRTPNEGYTAGSHSMQDSGTAIRNAAAQVRDILIAQAARRLDLPADQLTADNGAVVAPDGTRLPYGILIDDDALAAVAEPTSRLTRPADFRIINQPARRLDLPAKVTGGEAYVQDLRLPDLLHARVVRPPGPGARLLSLDTRQVEKMPGVVKLVADGNFLAVIAKKEYQAVRAMRVMAEAATWQSGPALPKQADIFDSLRALPAQDMHIWDKATPQSPIRTIEATYTRQYQSHGSIGPSCAVAHYRDQVVTVWTHTQGVYPDRDAIAEMLHLPAERVRCIHTEGAGCYGHNGADDAAADAAFLAVLLPGPPIRVQWMREQENAWEPLGPAMLTHARAGLDSDGKIIDWSYELWSNTHSTRPGPAGSLLAAQLIAEAFPQPAPKPLPMPEGGGDRNSIPLYQFPSTSVLHHFIPRMPLRVSALRSLGAYMNIFSIESFMDEAAHAAGADPVEFRLSHLQDPRARDVVMHAAERFGWSKTPSLPRGRGHGFAFARYKNLAAYCALAVEVEVDRETGHTRMTRAVAAVDSGQIVNPDGLRNQIEGAIMQSMSWTLYESVSFDTGGITSIDWSTYPILRFDAVPDSIDVHLIDRPGLPFLGAGECGQGPTAAALGNAIFNATNRRVRDLPMTKQRLKGAIGV